MKIEVMKRLEFVSGCERTLLFISDTHLGNGGGADDFGHNHDLFMQFLDWAGDENIVVLGDFLERWQFSYGEILNTYRNILERISHGTYGNHDRGNGFPEGLFCGDIYCIHGHQPDTLNNRWGWIGKSATWVAGLLERLGWQVDEVVTPAQMGEAEFFEWEDSRAVPWEKKLLRRHRGLLYGHTHRPLLYRSRYGIIGNTGCWVYPGHGYAIRHHPDRLELLMVRN